MLLEVCFDSVKQKKVKAFVLPSSQFLLDNSGAKI